MRVASTSGLSDISAIKEFSSRAKVGVFHLAAEKQKATFFEINLMILISYLKLFETYTKCTYLWLLRNSEIVFSYDALTRSVIGCVPSHL